MSTERLHSFRFMATMKLSSDELKISILQDLYPGVTSLACSSRVFETYDECISSCKTLMDDLMRKANISGEQFKMGSEVNPLHSGQPTLSKDWALGEVARLWVYDKSMEKSGQIQAVGQARVFAQMGTQPISTFN